MGSYVNSDGLFVRIGTSEATSAKGGSKPLISGNHEVEFELTAADIASATAAIPGSDAFGVVLPKGARIEEVETVVQTAFTVSSGTLGSATVVLGLKSAADRSTDLSTTALTTSSATATVLSLGTVGSKVVTRVGSTGAGAYLGTTLAANGVIAVANSTHGSNPFNAGVLKVRVRFFYP